MAGSVYHHTNGHVLAITLDSSTNVFAVSVGGTASIAMMEPNVSLHGATLMAIVPVLPSHSEQLLKKANQSAMGSWESCGTLEIVDHKALTGLVIGMLR